MHQQSIIAPLDDHRTTLTNLMAQHVAHPSARVHPRKPSEVDPFDLTHAAHHLADRQRSATRPKENRQHRSANVERCEVQFSKIASSGNIVCVR